MSGREGRLAPRPTGDGRGTPRSTGAPPWGFPGPSGRAPGGDGTGAAIELRAVRQEFGPLLALDGVDLQVPPRGRLAVVGPSGGGKSTLLWLVAGLLEPSAGSVLVGGEPGWKQRLGRCALMPQKDLLLPWRSALDNACLALENQGLSRAEARRRARPLFERFGLGEFERSLPGELSGGMRQRVAFLRTLLAGKQVLLLDEPFGALDSITRGRMQSWLAEALGAQPATVMLVTHDVEEALLLGDVVVVLSARPGRVVHRFEVGFPRGGPRREVVASQAFVAARQQLLEALE
jgi:ABC-type nitrate/sulfonate/bicarbonate transport system ATPase subunit